MGIVNPTRGQLSSETEGAGQTKEVNALTTLLNEFNGNIDAANVKAAFAKDVVEPAFSTYKDLRTHWVQAFAPAGAGTQQFDTQGNIVNVGSIHNNFSYAFALDPADRTAGARTTLYRLRAWFSVNQVAPAITYTFGLYPTTTSFSASGSTNFYDPGTVVAGSTVAFASPAASSDTVSVSGDFTAPAAGRYMIALVSSGTGAAGTRANFAVTLQYRQV